MGILLAVCGALGLVAVVGSAYAVGLSWLLVQWAGWPALAARFAAPWPGQGWTLPIARIGAVRYKNVVRARGSAEGLHLRLVGGIGAPPILVPWDQIRQVDRSSSLSELGEGAVIYELGTPAAGRMGLPDSVAAELERERRENAR